MGLLPGRFRSAGNYTVGVYVVVSRVDCTCIWLKALYAFLLLLLYLLLIVYYTSFCTYVMLFSIGGNKSIYLSTLSLEIPNVELTPLSLAVADPSKT